jgi:hypothetical protein
VIVLLAYGDDDDEEDKVGRGSAVRGTTYLAGGKSRKLAALKVPRQSPIVVLVKIRDDYVKTLGDVGGHRKEQEVTGISCNPPSG